MSLAVRILLAASAGTAFVQPALAQSNVSYICPSLNSGTGMLTVKVDTGCMTGMARYRDNDLKLVVDQNRALISVTGSINFHPIDSPAVIQDCRGARQFALSASGIEPRRYTVMFNGSHLGIADTLSESPSAACMYAVRHRRGSDIQHINQRSFHDWSDDPMHGWREWRGASVAALLAPIWEGHPDTTEGRPVVDLKIEKRIWNVRWPSRHKPWKSEPFVAVWITRHGLLDDSVSGDRFFAELRHDSTGWRIETLFGQNMCVRGEKAGQWTAGPCV